MSDLIAVAYPDTQTAKTVRALKELGQKLAPGGAALTVLVRKVTADKVLSEIASYGGT